MIEDPSFCGIAVDSAVRCIMHRELPERFVAFEGTNTWRRFVACAVKNVSAFLPGTNIVD